MQNVCFKLFLYLVLFLVGNGDDGKYEINLKEKIGYLRKCVGGQGHLQHDEKFDIFLISVNKPSCLDLLRNSAQDYLFNEAPTHFDIYVPAENKVMLKCNATFVLKKDDENITRLQAACVKP